MHYVTITGHSPSDMSHGVHKKQRHTPRHVSGRLSSFCCLLTSQTNLHKLFWYPPISDRPSRCRDSTIWQPCSGWTLWIPSTNNLALNYRSSSSAAFRAQLTGERDRPLCSNETSDLRQNWTLCDQRTSSLRITFELLSLEPRGYLVHMHAYGKSNTYRRRRPQGSMPGTTSSYHDVIIWGPPFCISCSR